MYIASPSSRMSICSSCKEKNDEIKYLKAIISLNALHANPTTETPERETIETVELKQQIKVMQNQLLIMRADVQYMNREVQSVFAWISKLITIFLRSCGRLGESTASSVIDSASKVTSSLARLVRLKTP